MNSSQSECRKIQNYISNDGDFSLSLVSIPEFILATLLLNCLQNIINVGFFFKIKYFLSLFTFAPCKTQIHKKDILLHFHKVFRVIKLRPHVSVLQTFHNIRGVSLKWKSFIYSSSNLKVGGSAATDAFWFEG